MLVELQRLYIVEWCVLWVCLIQGFVHQGVSCHSFMLVFVRSSCAVCPQGWLNTLYSIFSKLQVDSWWPKGSESPNKVWPPSKHEYYSEICFLLTVLSWRLFWIFCKFHRLFSQHKKKLDAISPFLKACHFIGLQWMQKVLNIDTFKHQLHKNAMFCCSMTYGNSQ